MIAASKKAKFIELRAEGLSFDTISNKLGISKPTLINLQRELDKEIRNITYLKTLALVEKYKLTKLAKIEFYLSQLEKLNKEIDKKDLSEVSYKDLCSIKQSMENDLKQELNSVSFHTGEFTSDPFNILDEPVEKLIDIE